MTARLIVRRVRRLNPRTVPTGQTEAFTVYRYHAIFTDSAEPMLAAEATHRDHAIIEQVIAELKNGPLAHLPSGMFSANAAWLACAAMAHNLSRAAGALAGGRTRTGTIRAQLIHTPGRIASSARRHVLHLPRDWPWEAGLDELFRRALYDPSRQPPDHRPITGPTGDRSGKAGHTVNSTTPTQHNPSDKINDLNNEDRRWIQAEHGDPEQAVTVLEHAVAVIDPYNEALYTQLIRLHRDQGRPDAARRGLCGPGTELATIHTSPSCDVRALLSNL